MNITTFNVEFLFDESEHKHLYSPASIKSDHTPLVMEI